MRWNNSKRPFPEPGEIRIVRRFILVPTCINGKCRWLELAYIKQEYNLYWGGGDWDDVEWVSE